MKHVEVKYHFIHEKVVNQDILIHHITTQDQIANVFRKGYSAAQVTFLRSKVMVISLPSIYKGAVMIYNKKNPFQEVSNKETYVKETSNQTPL